tara:strand:- start:24 stop:374 length:351 start_codon:yes stop_codon:yes gene_type:complete
MLAHLTHAFGGCVHRVTTNVEDDRSSMQTHWFDIYNYETVLREQMLERLERKVREMLVVHGIELEIINQRAEIWHLDDENTIVAKQPKDTAKKIIQIIHVCEHVSGQNPSRRANSR